MNPETPMTVEECEAASLALKHTGELPLDRDEREYLVRRLLATVAAKDAEIERLRVVAEAAERVRGLYRGLDNDAPQSAWAAMARALDALREPT